MCSGIEEDKRKRVRHTIGDLLLGGGSRNTWVRDGAEDRPGGRGGGGS